MAHIKSKRELKELFVDIPRHRRAAFMSKALGRLEEGLDELSDSTARGKVEAVKSAMQAFDLIEGIVAKVTAKEEAMLRIAKLISGELGSQQQPITVVIREAPTEPDDRDSAKPPTDGSAS